MYLFFIDTVQTQSSLLNKIKKLLKTGSDFWSVGFKRGALPLPVEQVNVDLYGLVDETCLQQSGLGLVDLTTEQQHVSQRRLPGRLLLDEVDVPHSGQLVGRRQSQLWAEHFKDAINV